MVKAPKKSKTQPQVYSRISFTDGELYNDKRRPDLEKIRRMRRQPTISLARQLVVAPVLAAQWNYITTDEAPEGAKKFIERQLAPFRMHLLKTTFQGYIDFGWQPYEKVFKVCRDGMLGIKKIKPLLQNLSTILINPKNGDYKGIKQEAYNTLSEVILNVPETLLVSLDVEGTDWYGHSIFEATEGAFDQYENARRGADRYDRKIAGSHWVIHYPPGESEYDGEIKSNDEVAQDILRKLEASGTIAVPRTLEAYIDELKGGDNANAWKVELLSDVSSATSNFIERLKYLDNLMVRTFGVPERAILEGQFGTKAEAQSHGDAAVINMDMRHRLAVVTYNQHLVNHLLRINWGEEYEDTVHIEPSPLEQSQRTLLARIYDRILQAPETSAEEIGAIDTEELRSELGIPTIDAYDEVQKGLADVLYSR